VGVGSLGGNVVGPWVGPGVGGGTGGSVGAFGGSPSKGVGAKVGNGVEASVGSKVVPGSVGLKVGVTVLSGDWLMDGSNVGRIMGGLVGLTV